MVEVEPPSATTTPTRGFALPKVTGSGAAALSQTPSPLLVPAFVRAVVPRIAPESSSTNHARADCGLASGTPTGSAPAELSICRIEIRACALMYGTRPSIPASGLKYQGRSVSVSFTSIIPALQGVPTVVSSVLAGWSKKDLLLIRRWTWLAGVPPICAL